VSAVIRTTVVAAAVATLGLLGLPPVAAVAAHSTRPAVVLKKSPNPLADPKHDTQPSQAFVSACSQMRTTKAANKTCDKAALKDSDAVRKKEGLGPMTLPRDFATLSVPSQLLAISNIERVDRGERPVLGRSKSLDKLALYGAKHDSDPDFPYPFPGTSGGANWAGAGNSALLDDFYWMYDDGFGSFNEDCPTKHASGCWGHRHDILNPYDSRLVMGAAVSRQKTGFGTSMTEEFIGGDRGNKVNVSPSWHKIAATFPPRVKISASAATVASGAAVTITGSVMSHIGHHVVAGQAVELQRRPSSSGSWGEVNRAKTGPKGAVKFVVHPTKTAMYRLVALAKSGAHESVSAALQIAIS
jgi:hypothetical protein